MALPGCPNETGSLCDTPEACDFYRECARIPGATPLRVIDFRRILRECAATTGKMFRNMLRGVKP